MDDYDEFDMEGAGSLVLKGLAGVGIASAISLIFALTISGEATSKFLEVITSIISLGINLNWILAFILNITLTNLISPVAYIWARAPELATIDFAGVSLELGVVSSIVSFTIAGIIVGILAKKDWLVGLQAGIITVGLTYAVSFGLIILSLVLANALLGGIVTVILLGTYVMVSFIMSLLSFLVCGISGLVGGLIYQRFIKTRY